MHSGASELRLRRPAEICPGQLSLEELEVGLGISAVDRKVKQVIANLDKKIDGWLISSPRLRSNRTC